MSNRPNTAKSRRNPIEQREAADHRRRLLYGAVIAVVVVGAALGIALLRNGAEPEATGISYGPVEVSGEALPGFTNSVDDAAVGLTAPVLSGLDFAEQPVTVGEPGQPTLVVFLAHWCPHCQAEVPVLVDMAEQGAFEGVRTVAVATGTNEQAVNYPPVAWLDREGWTGDVLVDSKEETAGAAYGIGGYPFLVMLDADGKVVGRTSGEKTAEEVQALVDAGRGSTAG